MTKDTFIPAIDPDSPVPLYHQIMVGLEGMIDSGRLHPGDQLPSERVLADELEVSRMTVRQAVRALVNNGYGERVRGRGIFVRKRPVVIDGQRFEGFTAGAARLGIVGATEGLGSRLAVPPDWVREDLGLEPDELTAELSRMRLIDGAPAILETEWFPADRFSGLLDIDLSKSLYSALDELFGVTLASTNDVVEGYLPDAEERRRLGLEEGVPVVIRFRVASTADGTPIEVVRSVYHPQQYEFRMTLVPVATGGEAGAVSRS